MAIRITALDQGGGISPVLGEQFQNGSVLLESRARLDGVQFPIPLDEVVGSQFGQMDVLSFDVRNRLSVGSIRRCIEINRRVA